VQRSSSTLQRSLASAICLIVLLVFLLGWHFPGTSSAETSGSSAYLPILIKDPSGKTEGAPPTATAESATPTIMPSSAATATPSATATSTPTSPAASATATTTPSPTTTPIIIPACRGVYPIRLDASLLDAEHFLPPTNSSESPYYLPYSDETYTNKWQRRIYLTSFDPAGFSFLRWQADLASGNALAIANALSGTGNVGQGFDEVVLDPPIRNSSGVQNVTGWPDPNTYEVPGYPLLPHVLSPGDWVYDASYQSISQGIGTALQAQIANRTVMLLQIVDRGVGAGNERYFHVANLASFLLRGYGNQAGRGWYLDLVYLGGPDLPSCP
jgi:hypothetical protein